ncbi:uncharacterized protein Z520_10785 [Fonsecaea multimorphosa CBS 102226]|uniref:DUF7726 domain-containing protein n=1 Tax=Fonsecaea multimorphosa CBS 102226 TaxID=1442371 RepID=A0A0D2JK32_9EURO|nr:uncharacterized protein Z520_10785 [Fonsecaea multimorphosa CBS 102226]KIX93607.1 hypothetical protein Z520_10785 [Fonsecaea multimorphosa CBS 102226]OAL18915.1 hypothetical protein AYO22_10244 [Fonsecaea multimorphosa]
MSLPAKNQPQPRDSFLDIASNLRNVSKSVNMPGGKHALQDRSVNIVPPAVQKRDGDKSAAGKKRSSDSNEDHIEWDGVNWNTENPNKKAKRTASTTTATTTGPAQKNNGASSKPKQAAAGKANNKDIDISSIHLDGEDEEAVPVYDTCDDIRTKINRFLRETPSASNAGFVRTINAAVQSPTTKTATAAQLSAFLKRKGPTGGAESPVFYNSYIFFEKLRIQRGKPKTKKRQEMETVWGADGMELGDMGKRRFFCHKDSRPVINQYGVLSFDGGRARR